MRALRQLFSLALLAAFAGPAAASTLQLEPVSIRLSPSTRSAVMQLRNSGSEPIHVQVRAYRWDQELGEDRLRATEELRVSPPIQAIPPGGMQYLRVLLAEGLEPTSEQSFRLMIDELPRGGVADREVQLLLRYSVPVIVRPAGLAPSDLRFRLLREQGEAVLVAANSGGQSAQLADLHFTTADGAPIRVNSGLLGYVLPGQHRRLPVPLPPGSLDRATGIQAQVDGKASRYHLEVAR